MLVEQLLGLFVVMWIVWQWQVVCGVVVGVIEVEVFDCFGDVVGNWQWVVEDVVVFFLYVLFQVLFYFLECIDEGGWVVFIEVDWIEVVLVQMQFEVFQFFMGVQFGVLFDVLVIGDYYWQCCFVIFGLLLVWNLVVVVLFFGGIIGEECYQGFVGQWYVCVL